jgi:hypothetical protein
MHLAARAEAASRALLVWHGNESLLLVIMRAEAGCTYRIGGSPSAFAEHDELCTAGASISASRKKKLQVSADGSARVVVVMMSASRKCWQG